MSEITQILTSDAIIIIPELTYPESILQVERIDSTDGRGHFEIF